MVSIAVMIAAIGLGLWFLFQLATGYVNSDWRTSAENERAEWLLIATGAAAAACAGVGAFVAAVLGA